VVCGWVKGHCKEGIHRPSSEIRLAVSLSKGKESLAVNLDSPQKLLAFAPHREKVWESTGTEQAFSLPKKEKLEKTKGQSGQDPKEPHKSTKTLLLSPGGA